MDREFERDPDSAWPHFAHPHEVGGRRWDCQECKSPRIIEAGGARICASCGYQQKPKRNCLACNTQLNAASYQIGLCYRCRSRDDEAASRSDSAGPLHLVPPREPEGDFVDG